MGLRSVFNVGDVVLIAPIDERIVAHLAEQVNGDDCFGLRGSGRLERNEVNAPMVGFDIHENGRGPDKGNARCRSDVGQGRDENLVTRPYAEETQGAPKGD